MNNNTILLTFSRGSNYPPLYLMAASPDEAFSWFKSIKFASSHERGRCQSEDSVPEFESCTNSPVKNISRHVICVCCQDDFANTVFVHGGDGDSYYGHQVICSLIIVLFT